MFRPIRIECVSLTQSFFFYLIKNRLFSLLHIISVIE